MQTTEKIKITDIIKFEWDKEEVSTINKEERKEKEKEMLKDFYEYYKINNE